ncbi:potassium transporter [Actibacterium mucosum KCTC 23349]|uniref:Potassium transporter n=1 Tax=Actibacterium mucosum KCTC 23349 TaxID=1454373 RepID=A0A037ZGJ6_9RHOB|nr:monovalent cation:proton antiporter-2 (CPA2) family protein [Actibacterium mucosum]KAJ55263.1 potassium transporter [Actibacterium mucosum KCTC 23349]
MQEILAFGSIYLIFAVIMVPIAARIGLGSVLGYLLAGVTIGPVLGLVGSETQDLQHVAEFGVVMMLFLIGLEMAPRTLWDMRHRLFGLGGIQIVLSIVVIGGGGLWIGLPWQTALAVGAILALSSTAIVMQTLTERGLNRTPGGRNAFAVLLTQDIAVIPMLALMPLLAIARGPQIAPDGSITASPHADAHHGETLMLFSDLPAWAQTLTTLGAIAAIILAGHYLSRPLFRFIHAARLREMFTIVALLIVVGIAALMNMVGLSPALGTFLAGVVLANSEFRHDLESNIEPFKGLLLGLFFITVGAGINTSLLLNEPLTMLGLALGLMAAKGAVLFLLTFMFPMRGQNRWLFTLSLAQAGEFGLVLVSFALQTHVLTQTLGQQLLLIISLSMLLTPFAFILHAQLAKRLRDDTAPQDPDDIDEQHTVIIAGIGRFGQIVNRMLQLSGYQATVLDHDLRTIELMRKFGWKGFLGDPTRPELLQAAGIATAKVLVAALDDKEATTRLVTHARRERPDLFIVARARDRTHVFELYRAGADHIVREMFDSSLRAARYVLEDLGLTEYEANEMETAFYKHDRKALLELAELWKPGVPADQNPEYMERAQALNKELEVALLKNADEEEAEEQAGPIGG